MALSDDFKARFPSLCSSGIDQYWPGLEVSWPVFYGGSYGSGDSQEDEIILNLIAHLLVVNQSKGPSLVSSSKSVGSVSVTKVVDSSMSNRESFFSSTSYGQAFWMMTQFRTGAFFV